LLRDASQSIVVASLGMFGATAKFDRDQTTHAARISVIAPGRSNNLTIAVL
jgi:hypothetical protein